jgi:hypothetical protein
MAPETTSAPIFDGPEGITVGWLTDVLRAAASGAGSGAGADLEIEAVEVSRVGTGQMGSCYRVGITYARGTGPDRLVVKLPADDPDVRARASLTYRAEVGFYRELAGRLPVSVPRCWLAEVDDDATSFTLVLEDLAPAAVGDQLAGCSPDQVRQAAVVLAGLHGGSWEDPRITGLDWLISSMGSFAELMQPMLADMVEGFLARRELTPDAERVFRAFASAFPAWISDDSRPTALVHGDYRLDNLLFDPTSAERPVAAVDWQSLSAGAPLRDLGYLVSTSLDPGVRAAHERDIVAGYHEALVGHGVSGYGVDTCWEDYRHGLFQGPLICLMGEAVAAETPRGLEMFTVMAERSAAAIVGLDALDLIEAGGSPAEG